MILFLRILFSLGVAIIIIGDILSIIAYFSAPKEKRTTDSSLAIDGIGLVVIAIGIKYLFL